MCSRRAARSESDLEWRAQVVFRSCGAAAATREPVRGPRCGGGGGTTTTTTGNKCAAGDSSFRSPDSRRLLSRFSGAVATAARNAISDGARLNLHAAGIARRAPAHWSECTRSQPSGRPASRPGVCHCLLCLPACCVNACTRVARPLSCQQTLAGRLATGKRRLLSSASLEDTRRDAGAPLWREGRALDEGEQAWAGAH